MIGYGSLLTIGLLSRILDLRVLRGRGLRLRGGAIPRTLLAMSNGLTLKLLLSHHGRHPTWRTVRALSPLTLIRAWQTAAFASVKRTFHDATFRRALRAPSLSTDSPSHQAPCRRRPRDN